MIKSRLRVRRTPRTVNIVQRNRSTSTYDAVNVYTNLVATWEQRQMEKTEDADGSYSEIVDVWFFEPVDCVLPTIAVGQAIYYNSTYYEVIAAENQGGENDRLMVTTNLASWVF